MHLNSSENKRSFFKSIIAPETSDQLVEELKQIQTTHTLIAFRQNVEDLFD
jgi:hypothetical protein